MGPLRLTLAVITATWGRPALSEKVLRWWAAREYPGWNVVRFRVDSPEDPDPVPYVEGWHHVAAPNQPLGRKWTACLNVALETVRPDAVMVVGSDDLISEGYMTRALRAIEQGADVVSCRDLFVWHKGDSHVALCESVTPGAGRVYSRAVLAKIKSRLWYDSSDRFLDRDTVARLKSVEYRAHTMRNDPVRSHAILDIKGPGSMWNLEGTDLVHSDGTRLPIRRVSYIPADQFFKDHFPDWQ